MDLKLKALAHMRIHVDVLLCATTVCVAAYMRLCVDVHICLHCCCSPLHPSSFAPVVASVHPWGRKGATLLLLGLEKKLLILLLPLGLDKDLFLFLLLLLGLRLQMLSWFLHIIMLHGALVLQKFEHLELHLQNRGQRLPINLLRTGSPPWAG